MLKLNIGAGDRPLPDHDNLDGKLGDTIYPLHHADGTFDEVRASHVLEHFPHREVFAVISDWVRVLKPGGVLKIAVPDLKVVVEKYLAGTEEPIEGYLMGGQVDERDFHKSTFYEAKLAGLLRAAGLVAIKRWKSEIADCAAMDVSLNLCGHKPPAAWPKVAAVISMPRLGFNDFWASAYRVLAPMGISLVKMTGAYWDRDLTIGIQKQLDEEDPEWILTADYDTVFTERQVQDLLSIATRYPHADAIAPLQTARHHDHPLFTCRLPDGSIAQQVERESIVQGEVIRVESAHFGLTLLRASKLKAMPKPWFTRKFDEAGGYGDNGCDPDVNFWREWKKLGNTLYIALRVPVGHCELMIRWPDENLEAAFQRPSDFWKEGPPANTWR